MPDKIGGFKCLPLKFTEKTNSPHLIYFKEHAVRDQSDVDRAAGRTLFVLNVPPYADEDGVKHVFSEAGTVDKVLFCEKPTTNEIIVSGDKHFSRKVYPTFKVAYVVFSKVVFLDNALNLTKLKPLVSQLHSIKAGVEKWIDEYNISIPITVELKEEIDNYMKNFDKKIDEQAANEKALRDPDNEGWVTVTKKGRHRGFARSENIEKNILEKEKEGKKRKELQYFYTFQIRESKMQNIISLRKKFEQDKKKIAQLKRSRRFKPF